MEFNLDGNLWNQLSDLLSTFGISLFIALCILVIGRQVVKVLIKVINSALERSKTEDTVRIFVYRGLCLDDCLLEYNLQLYMVDR